MNPDEALEDELRGKATARAAEPDIPDEDDLPPFWD
jgi:hypothetical protein